MCLGGRYSRVAMNRLLSALTLTGEVRKVNVFRKLMTLISDLNIRKKLLGVYILTTLLPVLLIGVYLSANLRSIIVDRAVNEASKDADRLADRIAELATTVVSISDRLIADSSAVGILQNEYDNAYSVMVDYAQTSIPNELKLYMNEVESIRFYAENTSLLAGGSFIYAGEDIRSASWYKETINQSGRIIWRYLSDDISRETGLTMCRRITLSKGVYAVLAIRVKQSYFDSLIRQESFNTVMAVNSRDVIFARDIRLIGTTLEMPQTPVGSLLADGSTILREDYQGEPSVFIRKSFHPHRNSTDSFQLFVVFPMEAIVGEANQVQNFAFLLIAAAIFISVILILSFTRYFTRRVQILSHAMHRVVNGNFSPSTGLKGQDEIGELHNDLNKIIHSINTLINEVYEEKLQKEQLVRKQNEAELKILASQINPHFFFNTLEAVRMKALCSGQKEIADILRLLGKSMRHILEIGNDLVPLSTELEYIEGYLQIQKFRYPDKFFYRIICPEDFDYRTYSMLPLILQPLAENAFVHGIENLKAGGEIRIRIEPGTERLVIRIEDNGEGMSSERLDELQRKMNKKEISAGESIGLCNVHQRIRLFYGEAYGVTLESRPGEGTRVTTVLPRHWEGKTFV